MSKHLSDRLAAELAVCKAATDGPWEADTYMTKSRRVIDMERGGFKTSPPKLYGSLSNIPTDGVYGELDGHDAEFIATARTGYPLALRALQAVMGLHKSGEMWFPATGERRQMCRCCQEDWPCSTIQRIREVYGDE